VSIDRVAAPDDPRLDDYRHLREPSLRVSVERRLGLFTVEGRLSVEALLASSHRLRSVLVDEKRLDALAPLLAVTGAPVYAVPHDVLGEVSGFAFHRGVLAAADRPDPLPVAEVAGGASRLVIAEGVNDFENLGSLYRNAAAFGVDGVLLDPTAADPLYRRVVRVSMGHVLRIPTARVAGADWPHVLGDLDLEVLALTPAGDETLDAVSADPPDRWAVLVGAEGPGLSDAAMAASSRRVRIPMADGANSVNVATAAAVALHALTAAGGRAT
jgi:tRNA G18 (ribose-2'-O)-methylase SpoU